MPLALTHLTLSHFRSHRHSALELEAAPIAISGPNGSGKTNLLEAVSLLSPGRGLRRATNEALIRKPQAVGWRIGATLQTPDASHDLDTRALPGNARQTRIDDKPSPQIALGRIGRILWLVPAMDRLWIEGAEGRRRFLDRLTLSLDPRHAEAALAYEKAMRERNRLLKDQVTDQRWYDALEHRMAQAGATLIANRDQTLTRLTQAQTGAKTAFPIAELALTWPDDAPMPPDPDALQAAFAASRALDMRAGRTLVGPHRVDLAATYADKAMEAAQCSTGEQKALLISLVLANARALSQDFGAPPILLLDEVAAHLDADRRAALYDEICALKAQAWMTGTGPELFEDLGKRAQHFRVTEVGRESHIESAH